MKVSLNYESLGFWNLKGWSFSSNDLSNDPYLVNTSEKMRIFYERLNSLTASI